MTIYIDFDRTIFDTDKFLENLKDILVSNGISVDLLLDYVNKDQANGFNIYNALKLMEKDVNVNSNVYKEMDKLFKKAEQYLYNDVYDFLKKVKKSGYKIFILTKGNDEYQLLKIKNTNTINYIDGVIVTLKDKGELDLNYQGSIFIDDNPIDLESIMKKEPKRIIRIKRVGAKYNSISVCEKIEEVGKLKDIDL